MRQRQPAKRDLSDLTGLRTGPYFRVSSAEKCKACKGRNRGGSGEPCGECGGTGVDASQEKSTGTQRRVFGEWADRAGVVAADRSRDWVLGSTEYGDPDISASRFAVRKNRPDFERMVADVKAGKLDILWFWEISRQQRRLEVFAELRNLCRDKGVLWVIRDRIADPADSNDMLLAGIQSMMGEQESERLSVRVTDGLMSIAKAGRPAGGQVPYGYRRIYDPVTRDWVRDEPDVFDGNGRPMEDSPAYVVREIYDRIKAGHSLYAIYHDLNNRGIKTPGGGKRWDSSAVRSIATNPRYAAMRIHQIEPGATKASRVNYVLEGVTGQWPALIDDATWWTVHRILTSPDRKTTKPHRPGGRLLSAVASCGACGAPITVNQSGRGVLRYTCRARSCASVPVRDLEDYVTAVMIRWLSDPETAADLASEADTEAVELALADIARAEAELADLHRQAEHGDITPALAGSFEKGISARIAEAKQRLANAETPPILKGRIGPGAENGWKAMTVPQRRQLIAAVADIRIHAVGKTPGPRVGSRPVRVPVDARVEWRWLTGAGTGQDAAAVAEKIAAHHAAEARMLTERIAHVAHLRAEGWERREIAAELGLSLSRLDHLIAEAKKTGIAQPRPVT